MNLNGKRTRWLLCAMSVSCFFAACGLYQPTAAKADGALVYDADGVNIQAAATDVYGVADNGEFIYAGADSFAADDALEIGAYTGNFGTENVVTWTQNAFSAITLNVTPVSAADYDTVKINYLGTNYGGAQSALYIYVFSSTTVEYVSENAVCSYVVPMNSNAQILMEIPSAELADGNGNVTAFTIARGYKIRLKRLQGWALSTTLRLKIQWKRKMPQFTPNCT